MIESLLPAATATAEAFRDVAEDVLFPAERRLVARAVPGRRREFATVRACARKALAELGHPPAPILPGTRGAPQWPTGVVGAMTHCAGYRAAVVAHAADLVALGIDAEPDEPIRTSGARDLVTLPEERAHLAVLAARRPGICWDRLLFSAKESVYKAWFPMTGEWLDFDQAMVTVDPDNGTFHARLLVPGPKIDGSGIQAFEGRWLQRHGLLLTTVALPRTPAATWADRTAQAPMRLSTSGS